MLGDMELLMRYLILELRLMMMRMEEERLVGVMMVDERLGGVMMVGAKLVKRFIYLLTKVG